MNSDQASKLILSGEAPPNMKVEGWLDFCGVYHTPVPPR